MTRRRNLYRKQPERRTSRKGLMLCLVLAGAVVLVPVGGNLINTAKSKARDLALNTGVIKFDDCVVTATQTIDCSTGADGTPVPVALRQMMEQKIQSAEDTRLRAEAEASTRSLKAELEGIKAELAQSRLAAARTGGFLPPFVTTVTRTGVTLGEATDAQSQQSPSEPMNPAAYEPTNDD